MMKVRMLHQRSGGRYDGQPWPERGGELDVPDEEAEDLIRQGIAEAVEVKAPAKAPAKAKPAG